MQRKMARKKSRRINRNCSRNRSRNLLLSQRQDNDLAARSPRLPLYHLPQRPPPKSRCPHPIFDLLRRERVPVRLSRAVVRANRTRATCLQPLLDPPSLLLRSILDIGIFWTSFPARQRKFECQLSLRGPRCAIWSERLVIHPK
jgi:hypothetical protein